MKMKVSLVIVAAVIALGFFIMSNSEGETQAQYPLDKFYQALEKNPARLNNKPLTIFGYVKEGSIEIDGADSNFIVKSEINELKVHYPGENGLLPDTFEDGSEVTIDGTYDQAQHLIVAKNVLAKCDSKYNKSNVATPAEQ
ncbi:MAG: cytochrome c maturation protein CcmE [Leptospirales bacterium]